MAEKKSKTQADGSSRLVNLHPRLRRIVASFVGLSILARPLNKALATEFQNVVYGWRRDTERIPGMVMSLTTYEVAQTFIRSWRLDNEERSAAFVYELQHRKLAKTDSVAPFSAAQTRCLGQHLGTMSWPNDENGRNMMRHESLERLQMCLRYLHLAYGLSAFLVVKLNPWEADKLLPSIVAIVQPTKIDYLALENSTSQHWTQKSYAGPSAYAVRPPKSFSEPVDMPWTPMKVTGFWIPVDVLAETPCPHKCDGQSFCFRCGDRKNWHPAYGNRNWSVRPGVVAEPVEVDFASVLTRMARDNPAPLARVLRILEHDMSDAKYRQWCERV